MPSSDPSTAIRRAWSVIEMCPHKDTEDGTCSHPTNPTPECHAHACPLVPRGSVVQAARLTILGRELAEVVDQLDPTGAAEAAQAVVSALDHLDKAICALGGGDEPSDMFADGYSAGRYGGDGLDPDQLDGEDRAEWDRGYVLGLEHANAERGPRYRMVQLAETPQRLTQLVSVGLDVLGDEPHCNHDAPAVRGGVCECGETVGRA